MRAELQNHADACLGIDGKIKSERRPAGANPLATFALTQTPSLVCIERLQFKTTVSIGSLVLRSPPFNMAAILPLTTLRLLDVSSSAGVFQLLLDAVSIGLRHAILHNGRHAFDQILRFLQAEAGDFADDLNHADFVGAEAGHGDGEFRLLFHSRSRRSGTAACSSNSNRSSGAYAPLLFECLDQIHNLHHLEVGQCFNQFVLRSSHCRNSEKKFTNPKTLSRAVVAMTRTIE